MLSFAVRLAVLLGVLVQLWRTHGLQGQLSRRAGALRQGGAGPVRGPRLSISYGRCVPQTMILGGRGVIPMAPRGSMTMKPVPSSRLHFKVSENDEAEDLDLDEEIEFDEPSFDGTAMLGKISKAAILVAASLGFAAAPTAVIGARVAGAAAGSVAGVVLKRVVDNRIVLMESEDPESGDGNGFGGSSGGMGPSTMAVTKALAEVEASTDPSAFTLLQLEAIARKNQVLEKDLGEFITFVFAEVVGVTVLAPSADLTTLIEVIGFAEECNLTQSEVGDGFSLAAAKMGNSLERDNRGYFVDEYDPNVLLAASKIFFLADKMMGTSSEGYYGKRLSVTLSFFESSSFKEQLTEACTNLWSKCINAVLKSADKFSSEEVADLRSFIEVSASASDLRPAMMQSMVMELLKSEMDSTLQGASGQTDAFTAALPHYENLQKAKTILGCSGIEFESTLSVKTLPLFEDAVKALVQELSDDPTPDNTERCSQRISERIAELRIEPKKARSVLTTAISQKNAEYMNRIEKVYGASGGDTVPAFKTMTSFASVHECLSAMSAPFMDGLDIPVPGLPFADMVRVSMFEMKLKGDASGLSSGAVKDEMFSLNEEQQKIVKKNMALPKIVSWVTQCLSERNFNEGAKNAYEKLLAEYEVSQDAWSSTAIDFYYQEAQSVSARRAIPSSEDMEELASVASFLSCPEELVTKVHMEVLGDKYSKALNEAMTPSGVITEEYVDGLDRLRQRLCLSEADAKSLVGFTARKRMGPILKDLVDVWKSDTDANYRMEKEKEKRSAEGFRDKARDNINNEENIFGYMELGANKEGGGPNVFMREALNLVDNFKSNYAAVADASIEASEDGTAVLPVNAGGISSEEDLTGLFKHDAIARVAEQDPGLKARYIEEEPIFAALLGLPKAEQEKVKESLGYSAYKNMLMNLLKHRDIISSQEQMQFTVLTDQIGLSAEAAAKVEKKASQHALREHAAELVRLPSNLPPGASRTGGSMTAETANRFRNQVTSLGLDIQQDTGCTPQVVTFMYALEIQDMIERGDADGLADAQEGYGIPEERASEMVEVTSRRYVSQILNFALRAARKYNEQEAVLQVKKVLDFAQFIDVSDSPVDADGNMFSEDDKDRLIAFHEGSKRQMGGVVASAGGNEGLAETGSGTSTKEDAEMLRALINLTEDYKPAEGGIDGLLGLIKDFKGVGEEGGGKFANTGW